MLDFLASLCWRTYWRYKARETMDGWSAPLWKHAALSPFSLISFNISCLQFALTGSDGWTVTVQRRASSHLHANPAPILTEQVTSRGRVQTHILTSFNLETLFFLLMPLKKGTTPRSDGNYSTVLGWMEPREEGEREREWRGGGGGGGGPLGNAARDAV